MKNAGLIAITALAAALIAWLIYERFIVSDEARIKRVLTKIERALEEHDLNAFMDNISPQYRDEWGNVKGELQGLVLIGMREFETIEVDISELTVEVEGKRATAVFYPSCRIAGDTGESFDVDKELLKGALLQLTFEKTENGWLAIRAEPLTEEK